MMTKLSARVVSVHAGSNDDMSKEEHASIEVALDGIVGDGVMIVADGYVGVRLLLLARRTRALPELCFGLSFVSLGVIGWALYRRSRNSG